MEDDLILRRKEKLSPKAQTLYNDINKVGKAGAEMGSPEFEGAMHRISRLPPAEQQELLALLTAKGQGLMRQAEEALEVAEMMEGAERVFKAAHEKLRSEGKPIDPHMTLREAYEVLGLA